MIRFRKNKLRASITLEASLALPLFIFFFANIMTLFNIVKVQSDLEAALHQTGSEMSLMAFDAKFGEETLMGEGSDALEDLLGAAGILYAKNAVSDYMKECKGTGCIKGGIDGVGYLRSGLFDGNDIIDIVLDYRIKPMIPVIGFKEFKTESRFYGHAFTGYDIFEGLSVSGSQEEMVFVTEHGEVFHRDAGCVHLHVKTRSIAFGELKKARNNDGKKYYPCEYCGGGIGGGAVFITDYGERYHSSVNCPGLKRKIYTIPISEALGKRPCSSCG